MDLASQDEEILLPWKNTLNKQIRNEIINNEEDNKLFGEIKSNTDESNQLFQFNEINEKNMNVNGSFISGDLSCINNGFILAPEIPFMDVKYLR